MDVNLFINVFLKKRILFLIYFINFTINLNGVKIINYLLRKTHQSIFPFNNKLVKKKSEDSMKNSS